MELTDEMQNKIVIASVIIIVFTVLFCWMQGDKPADIYPNGSYTPRDELLTLSER